MVGDKEMQAGTVAVRSAQRRRGPGAMALEAFTARLQAEAKAR